MPRLARRSINTPFLHVMVQGVNKEYIFEEDKYKEKYLEIMSKEKKKYEFTIMAYCIMDNHAHFLVYTEDICSFGKFMQKVNFTFATLFNKLENRVGVLFRNRYQTEPIYDEKYLFNCIKYIHDNPVKAGMVLSCEDYNYSSYNDYINNKGIANSQIVKKIFGDNFDYLVKCKYTDNMRFLEIDAEGNDSVTQYIIGGIKNYKQENNKNLIDIFSSKETFVNLVKFLKESNKIKYNEMYSFFEISKKNLYRLMKNY